MQDDRAIRLDLDALLAVAEQMPATEDVLEKAKEDFNCTSIYIHHGNRFRRYVDQVGADPQQAIAGWPSRVAAMLAAAGMRAGPNSDQANLMIDTRFGLAEQADLDALVADDVERAVGIGQRQRLAEFRGHHTELNGGRWYQFSSQTAARLAPDSSTGRNRRTSDIGNIGSYVACSDHLPAHPNCLHFHNRARPRLP